MLSIIIPIYNEALNIDRLFERLLAVAEAESMPFEFIFINDGSKDNSMQLIRQLAERHPSVKYIDLARNFGHQIAVSAGLDHAKGKYIAIIDADLQDPPELIHDMLLKMNDGFEVVYARRRARKGESLFKRITAKLFYRVLAKLTSFDIPLDTGDFRIVERKVVDILTSMPEKNKFLRGQISWIGFRQTFVEYDRDERHAGKTGYTLKKMISFALDGITSFSNAPLKLASTMGFIVSGISFTLILYALYSRFILKDYEPGWTSLMLVVLFIGGIQLICIGIIGEYISRISDNVRDRPLYVVNVSNIEE